MWQQQTASKIADKVNPGFHLAFSMAAERGANVKSCANRFSIQTIL